MPLFTYRCSGKECNYSNELLNPGEHVYCPDCESELVKQMSSFNIGGKGGSGGMEDGQEDVRSVDAILVIIESSSGASEGLRSRVSNDARMN